MGIFNFRRKAEAVIPGAMGAGARFTLSSADALENSAYWSCMTLLCQKMATIPVAVRKDGTSRELGKYNAIAALLERPNRYMTAYQFRYIMEFNFESHGLAIAIVKRASNNRPVELYPVSPATMTAHWTESGDLRFRCNSNGQDYAREDLLIIWNTPASYDTVLSPLTYARSDLDLANQSKNLQKEYYKGGAVLGRLVKVPQTTYDKSKEQIRAAFESATGFRNMILPDNVQVEPLKIEGEDVAKLIDAQAWDMKEVARRFHVPPCFLGDTSGGYGSQEQQSIRLVTECLQPRCKAWEIAINTDLCDSGEYVKFELQGLMRGDHATRQAWYTAMLTHGVMSINEVRELEDMEPIGAEGDVHYFQAGFANVKDIANGAFTKNGTSSQEESADALPAIVERAELAFDTGDFDLVTMGVAEIAEALGLSDWEWVKNYTEVMKKRHGASWNATEEAYRAVNAVIVRKATKEGKRYTLDGIEPIDGYFEEAGKKFRNPPAKAGDRRFVKVWR